MAFGASPAVAESQIGLYGGWNGSFDSDIHLSQPNGTNMTLNGVPWDGDSFGAPPYWGLRGTYWLNSAPNWGVMIDYSHAKVIADRARWGRCLGQPRRRQVGLLGPRRQHIRNHGVHRRPQRDLPRRPVSLAA